MTLEEAINKVNQPGKFEGQEPWVPIAYEEALDGAWNDGVDDEFFVEVTDDDIKEWNLSHDTVALVIQEMDNGFVIGEQLNQYDYDRYMINLEG